MIDVSPVTILDGGMGKELRRIGAPFRQPEWSSLALIEAPDRVVEAHDNFIRAGAQVITTNNYAVVPYHHTADFFAARGDELTALAGRLARTAADAARTGVRVAGSMPPLFGSYEPDRFDAARAAPLYARIAAALDPFVDIWLGETLSTIAEMRTIVGAIADLRGDRPVWMSFAVPDAWEDDRIALRSGESIDEIVDAVDAEGLPVSALLINCSIPEQTGPALAALRAARDRRGLDVRTRGVRERVPDRPQRQLPGQRGDLRTAKRTDRRPLRGLRRRLGDRWRNARRRLLRHVPGAHQGPGRSIRLTEPATIVSPEFTSWCRRGRPHRCHDVAMNRRRISVLVAAVGLTVTACGTSDPAATTDPPATDTAPTEAAPATDAPPATPAASDAPTAPPATEAQATDTPVTDTPATDPPATEAPPAEPQPAPVGGRALAPTVEADSQFDGNPFPDLVVNDVGRGGEANIANILPADRPVLLWTWAPH